MGATSHECECSLLLTCPRLLVVSVLLSWALLSASSLNLGSSPSERSFAVIYPDVHADASIAVDPGVRFQTITGWSATAWAAQDGNPAFANYSDMLFDLAVFDLRLNRLRVEVRAGVENPDDYWSQYMSGQVNYSFWRAHRYSTINDNNDPNLINWSCFHFSELDNTIEKVVLPIKQRMESVGEELLVNVNYVAFTGQIGPGLQYIHDDPEEYAELVLATYLHLQSNYSIIPDTWEILLEPDNVAQWNGNLIGRAMVAVAARLEAHGFTPSFIAPSNTNMGNAISYFDAMVAVPGAVQNLTEFSYHRYGGVSDSNLRAIADRRVVYSVNTSMLEHIGSSYQDLYKDLTIANVSAWQQFTLGGPGGGDSGGTYYLIDDTDPANPTVTNASRTKFLRQYFKFIRPGAVRIATSSDNLNFEPAAFVNTNGGYVVVVNAASGGSMSIQGLASGTYGIKYTTSSQYNFDLPDVSIGPGQLVNASIPNGGVITIYGMGEPRPPILTSADLSGQNLENVTISWELSLDDGVVLGHLTGYHIMRNFTYERDGMGYQLIAIVPNGTRKFVDSYVGEGDPGNYFYQVCAVDVNNNISCSLSQAGKFTRLLSVGVNLISVPLIQSDEDIETVLQTAQWNSAWTYQAGDPIDSWKSTMTPKSYRGDLRAIDHRSGVWVNIVGVSNLTVAGIVPKESRIPLYAGWNLVGFPSFMPSYTVSMLKAMVGAVVVEGFDQVAIPYHLKEMLDWDLLRTGYGHWVYVPSDVTWIIPFS